MCFHEICNPPFWLFEKKTYIRRSNMFCMLTISLGLLAARRLLTIPRTVSRTLVVGMKVTWASGKVELQTRRTFYCLFCCKSCSSDKTSTHFSRYHRIVHITPPTSTVISWKYRQWYHNLTSHNLWSVTIYCNCRLAIKRLCHQA